MTHMAIMATIQDSVAVTSDNKNTSELDLSYSSSTFDEGSVASASDSPESGIVSSSSSGSESEQASKSEPEEVHPFLYEPLTSSNSEDDNASDSSEDLSPRLLNLDGKSTYVTS